MRNINCKNLRKYLPTRKQLVDPSLIYPYLIATLLAVTIYMVGKKDGGKTNSLFNSTSDYLVEVGD